MKKMSLCIAVTILLVTSCKKETYEPSGASPAEPETEVQAAPPNCSGDVWIDDLDFVGLYPHVSAVYNNKVYFFNSAYGGPHPYHKKITIFDGSSWQTISSEVPFQSSILISNIGFVFVIGNKAYFGNTEVAGSNANKVYVYDFPTNTWGQTLDYPGHGTSAYFTINGRGYVMGAYNETWEFTPASFFTINKWVAKANYPGPVLGYATGFAINSKGYLANGFGHTTNPTYQNSLYEYSPSTNTWSSKANFPGAGREMSRSFVSSGYGYVGGGKNAEVRFIDFYRYSPWENKWIRIADYNPLGVLLNCFVINSQGYAVWSTNYFQPYKMRKYIPKTCVPLSP